MPTERGSRPARPRGPGEVAERQNPPSAADRRIAHRRIATVDDSASLWQPLRTVEAVKVIARFADGRVAKGHTLDFNPAKAMFHLLPMGAPTDADQPEIAISELKALFFVRDFTGNPHYTEKKDFSAARKPAGRRIEVTFKDGEVLVGSTMGYDKKRQGFFLFPADPISNNQKVYVVNAAVKSARYLV